MSSASFTRFCPSFSSIFRIISWIFLFFALVSGQSTHIVQVGWDGSFFTPATVSALLNDTVRFVFAGNFHSVTQSTFQAPCSPQKGGFDSGPVRQSSDGEFPFWDLKITNVSQPIWYFCYIGTPTSHCNAGMVGVINPASIQDFNDFLSSAKQVTGTPQVTPTVRLTGIGALATAAPALSSSFGPLPISSAPPLSSSTESSTSSTASSSSETPSSTAVPASGGKKTNVGAIAGGTVAGVVGLLLIVGLFFWWQHNKNNEKTVNEFFNYRMPPPPRPASDAFNSNMMLSSTGRRVLPPPSQPHYTTPVAPRPRRRSFENDGAESNRGSVPTYSSDAKSSKSTEGFIPPRPIAHPYMGVLASDSPPVSVPHLTSSQHGHGGSHQGHGHGLSNGSSTQLAGGAGDSNLPAPASISKRQLAQHGRDLNPNPLSVTSIESPAPPMYQAGA